MYNPNFPTLRSDMNPDQAARAAGFSDFADYQNKKAQNDAQNPTVIAQRQADQAKSEYGSAISGAVAGLQGMGSSLDAQYEDLLGKVLGQGTVALNTVTTGENNLLASRGITNNSPLYSKEMGSAQLPVTAQNQAAVGSLGYTQAQLKNTLAQTIAGIQSGAAGTSAMLPLEFGSLALQQQLLPSQIGLNTAQGSYYGGNLANALNIARLQYGEPFGVSGGIVFNPGSGSFVTAKGGGGDMASALEGYFASKAKPAMSIGRYVK